MCIMSLTLVHKQSCVHTWAPFSIGDFPPELRKNVCPHNALSGQGLARTVASKLGQFCQGQIFMTLLKKKNVRALCGKKKLQLSVKLVHTL